MKAIHKSSLAVVVCALAALSLSAQVKTVTVIKAGRMIDTINGRVLNDQVIIIEGDRIKEVGSGLAMPAEATVINLSKMTVLPGLTDAHTHITTQAGGDYYEELFRKSFIDEAVNAHIYSKRTLEGFTTVRNVGASAFIMMALKHSIDKGDIVGPRVIPATMFIGSTGSHGDLNGFSPLDDKTPSEMSALQTA
jgi:imidazolonepropionase-like amidohydrolase